MSILDFRQPSRFTLFIELFFFFSSLLYIGVWPYIITSFSFYYLVPYHQRPPESWRMYCRSLLNVTSIYCNPRNNVVSHYYWCPLVFFVFHPSLPRSHTQEPNQRADMSKSNALWLYNNVYMYIGNSASRLH